jgi:hypothetical protein
VSTSIKVNVSSGRLTPKKLLFSIKRDIVSHVGIFSVVNEGHVVHGFDFLLHPNKIIINKTPNIVFTLPTTIS